MVSFPHENQNRGLGKQIPSKMLAVTLKIKCIGNRKEKNRKKKDAQLLKRNSENIKTIFKYLFIFLCFRFRYFFQRYIV